MRVISIPISLALANEYQEDRIPIADHMDSWKFRDKDARQRQALMILGHLDWPDGSRRRGTPEQCRAAYEELK